MRPRRPIVAARRRFFVGCEGESEQGYVVLLQRLADASRLSIHIDVVLLRPGGGDPLGLVELAAKRAAEGARKRGAYEARFVLLDDDKLGLVLARDARIEAARVGAGLELIWQRTCHEALLLRHLDGCAQRRPATTPLALAALVQEWPAYGKGMAAARLAERIDQAAVARAAQVEPELAALLARSGLVG